MNSLDDIAELLPVQQQAENEALDEEEKKLKAEVVNLKAQKTRLQGKQ